MKQWTAKKRIDSKGKLEVLSEGAVRVREHQFPGHGVKVDMDPAVFFRACPGHREFVFRR